MELKGKLSHADPIQAVERCGPSTKICTTCSKQKSAEEFHKNRSKPGGLDSSCKTCVVGRKKRRRKKAKKARLETTSLQSTICGSVDSDNVLEFCEAFSESLKDLLYDKKL